MSKPKCERYNINVQCPKCERNYSDPKLVHCCHVVCRTCIPKWIENKDQEPCCPLCKSTLLSPFPEQLTAQDDCIQQMVDRLPADVAASTWVEYNAILVENHFCSVCSVDTCVTTFCLDCYVKLCTLCCKKKHGGHLQQQLTMLNMKLLMEARISYCDTCSRYQKKAEHYCHDHRKLCCTQCFQLDHKMCLNDTNVTATDVMTTLTGQAILLRRKESDLLSKITQLHDVQKQAKMTCREIDALGESLSQEFDMQCQEFVKCKEHKVHIQEYEREVGTAINLLKQKRYRLSTTLTTTEWWLKEAPDDLVLRKQTELKVFMEHLEQQSQLPADLEKKISACPINSELLTNLARTLNVPSSHSASPSLQINGFALKMENLKLQRQLQCARTAILQYRKTRAQILHNMQKIVTDIKSTKKKNSQDGCERQTWDNRTMEEEDTNKKLQELQRKQDTLSQEMCSLMLSISDNVNAVEKGLQGYRDCNLLRMRLDTAMKKKDEVEKNLKDLRTSNENLQGLIEKVHSTSRSTLSLASSANQNSFMDIFRLIWNCGRQDYKREYERLCSSMTDIFNTIEKDNSKKAGDDVSGTRKRCTLPTTDKPETLEKDLETVRMTATISDLKNQLKRADQKLKQKEEINQQMEAKRKEESKQHQKLIQQLKFERDALENCVEQLKTCITDMTSLDEKDKKDSTYEGLTLFTSEEEPNEYICKDCKDEDVTKNSETKPEIENEPLVHKPVGSQLAAVIKVNDRVKRSQEWCHGDQDGSPPGHGTVTEVPTDHWKGYVKVQWDAGGSGWCIMGDSNIYELELV